MTTTAMCEPWCRDHEDISNQCDAPKPDFCNSAYVRDLYVVANGGRFLLVRDAVPGDGGHTETPLPAEVAYNLAALFNDVAAR